MALVHLVCTAKEEQLKYSRRDFERLLKFSECDEVGAHSLTDSIESADIIIFVGSSDVALSDVTKSNIYKSHKRNCVLMESGDRCVPLLPGIYAGLEKRWAVLSCQAALSGYYLRVTENESMEISDPIDSSTYLFSFIGSAKNHRVREKILQIDDSRAFIKDSSKDSRQQDDGITGKNENRGILYRDIMAHSKFSLCPRGVGVSSWRLFETMRAGRVPVIISDQWLPPQGPDWSKFIVRVSESDVLKIPHILREIEVDATKLGSESRRQWMSFYSKNLIFNTVVDNCLFAFNHYNRRNRLIYSLRRIQYLDPFFMRYWVVSPMLRKLKTMVGA